MVHSFYNLTRKGWLKALSFILASMLFAMILMNANLFAQYFGGYIPYLAMLAFYGMTILWIHGIGFEIESAIWRLIFLPMTGYLIVISSLTYLVSLK